MTQQTEQEQAITKDWTNIDYTNTSAYRTIKAFNKEGIYGEGGPAGQVPQNEYAQYNRLQKLDSILKPEKRPIQKIITHLSRQLVLQPDTKGTMVPKEVLTTQGEFRGLDWSDEEVGQEFYEGWNKKPVMAKIYDNSRLKLDPETGQDLGKWRVRNTTFDFFYELPKDAAKRKKYIDNIIENANGTYPENTLYYYRDLGAGNNPIGGTRDGTFSYEQFTSLSIEELRDTSKRGAGSKGSGYWRDNSGKLHKGDE